MSRHRPMPETPAEWFLEKLGSLGWGVFPVPQKRFKKLKVSTASLAVHHAITNLYRQPDKKHRWTIFVCDTCDRLGWRFRDAEKCNPPEHTHQGSHGGPIEVMPVAEHEMALEEQQAQLREAISAELSRLHDVGFSRSVNGVLDRAFALLDQAGHPLTSTPAEDDAKAAISAAIDSVVKGGEGG